MRRLTLITSMQHERLRRKRQWNYLVARLDSTGKPNVMSLFPLWKVKGTQPTKIHDVWVATLEEESTDKEEGTGSEDPNDIEGVTKKFILHLPRVVKDTQQEEKHCYHCVSPEHFIRNCPLLKASRTDSHLNQKEEMALKDGA